MTTAPVRPGTMLKNGGQNPYPANIENAEETVAAPNSVAGIGNLYTDVACLDATRAPRRHAHGV